MEKGSKEYKERNKAYSRDYRRRNPDANKKRYKEDKFVMLVRAETKDKFDRAKSCMNCGSTEQLEFHHLEYKRPVKEEYFITLCKSCHIEQHKEKKVDNIKDTTQNHSPKENQQSNALGTGGKSHSSDTTQKLKDEIPQKDISGHLEAMWYRGIEEGKAQALEDVMKIINEMIDNNRFAISKQYDNEEEFVKIITRANIEELKDLIQKLKEL